ncbi:unnamed protein product, partial [Symbiodinium microadriaticum]
QKTLRSVFKEYGLEHQRSVVISTTYDIVSPGDGHMRRHQHKRNVDTPYHLPPPEKPAEKLCFGAMELPLSVLLILLEDADNMVLDMEATGSGIERDEHGRDMEAWDFKLQEGKSYMMHGVGEAVTHMKTQDS